MQQLEIRRAKAGRAFGPMTLRGRMPLEARADLDHLQPGERVAAVLGDEWRTVTEICDLADVPSDTVRHACRRLILTGSAEQQSLPGRTLYRRSQASISQPLLAA